MVEFYNNGKKLVELCKDRPIGILDLCSIGYYKVNYQRLIAMAEEKFDLFHYCKAYPLRKIKMLNSIIECQIPKIGKE